MVRNRLKTQWGSAAIMDAERAVLLEALRDPSNERWVGVGPFCLSVDPASGEWEWPPPARQLGACMALRL